MAKSFRVLADDMGTEVVTIFVGPSRQQFVVHKNLLVTQSNYFKGALASNLFKEAVEGVMTFEEDDPDAFRLLVNWVYTHQIPRVQPFITKPDFSKSKGKESSVKVPIPPLSRVDVDMTVELPDPDPEDENSKVIARHLSARGAFEKFSPEEIRLGDYKAAENYVADPLRRDAGVTPKKDELREHSRLRQEWLNRKTPIATVVDRTQKVRVLGTQSQALNNGNVNKDVGGSVSEKTTSATPSDSSEEAQTGNTTPSTDGGSDPTNLKDPSSLLAPNSRLEFTFRMEKPPQEQTDQDAVLPKKGPLTFAATAALGEHPPKSPLTAAPSPKAAEGTTGSETAPRQPSTSSYRNKKKPKGDVFPGTLPPAKTAAAWAARLEHGSEDTTATPEEPDQQQQQDKENKEPETDWPFGLKPELSVVTAKRWFDWKSGPNDPVFTSQEHASEESNRHQLTLLRLLALAEKLCWDRLFNAAMDAYLDGEALMNRRLVPLAHLHVAYTLCSGTSPLRRFLSDMVHFEARTCLTHSRYLEFAQACEDFLADLFRRLDQRSWIPGKHQYAELRNPLRVRRCVYHYHEEWSGVGCF